jgi:hypothetical protein
MSDSAQGKKIAQFKETVQVRPFNHTLPPSFLSPSANTSEHLVNQNQQARYFMHPDYLNIVNAVKPKRSITPSKVLQIERGILGAQKQALEEAGSNQEKRDKVDLSYSFLGETGTTLANYMNRNLYFPRGPLSSAGYTRAARVLANQGIVHLPGFRIPKTNERRNFFNKKNQMKRMRILSMSDAELIAELKKYGIPIEDFHLRDDAISTLLSMPERHDQEPPEVEEAIKKAAAENTSGGRSTRRRRRNHKKTRKHSR